MFRPFGPQNRTLFVSIILMYISRWNDVNLEADPGGYL